MQIKTYTAGFCIAFPLLMVDMASQAETSRIIYQQMPAWIYPNLKISNADIEKTLRPSVLTGARKNFGITKGFEWEDSKKSQYAIYRSPGKVYFKGKAGYISEGLEEDIWDMPLQKAKNTLNEKGALGLGAGYRLNDGTRFEVEYTVNKQDEQQLRLGYQF